MRWTAIALLLSSFQFQEHVKQKMHDKSIILKALFEIQLCFPLFGVCRQSKSSKKDLTPSQHFVDLHYFQDFLNKENFSHHLVILRARSDTKSYFPHQLSREDRYYQLLMHFLISRQLILTTFVNTISYQADFSQSKLRKINNMSRYLLFHANWFELGIFLPSGVRQHLFLITHDDKSCQTFSV